MIFNYNKWNQFCCNLKKCGLISIPACEVDSKKDKYLVLKHDVETDVMRAVELAKIENKYGHRGTYYVQAYLLDNSKNIKLLKIIKKLGHEVSYHYDVMDSNKGNLDEAIKEFEKNRKKFENAGFPIVTVCQHGNPIVERVGYTSNRDFFRSDKVQRLYPKIADIMVDYKQKYNTDYSYFSDAGRKFSKIYDPLENDRINSDDKNIKYEDLNKVLNVIKKEKNVFISTHPHRWTKTAFEYVLKNFIFYMIKKIAKLLIHIPFMKKLMSRYYYLAKKV